MMMFQISIGTSLIFVFTDIVEAEYFVVSKIAFRDYSLAQEEYLEDHHRHSQEDSRHLTNFLLLHLLLLRLLRREGHPASLRPQHL
jgi:hypothetical protein